MSEGGAVAAGSIGIASIASVVAAPVGFILTGMAIGLGAAAIAMKYARRKITKQLKLKLEFSPRVNSIPSAATFKKRSKTIVKLSQEEFVLISEERAKYLEMKENIRTKFTHKDTPKDAPPDIKAIGDKENLTTTTS